MLKHARRATIALTTSTLLATGLGAAPAAQAAPSGVTPQAARAAGWLAGQLDGGLVASEYQSKDGWVAYTDHGLTLDFFFALQALDVRKPAQQRILDAIEPQVDDYVAAWGTTYAGALGKLLAAVQAHGTDPSTYGEGDLVARLEERVHTAEDSERGRAKDSPGDTSNTIGQSFVVQALADADSALADEAVEFLLKQQCSNGFFRVYMESADHSCDTGRTTGESGPSVDATAAALLALREARAAGVEGVDRATVTSALVAGKKWLVKKQRNNGSFAEDGIPNANSTGLAAQALAALGRPGPAAKAASWLDGLRVTKRLVRRSDYKRRDIGAVAFSKAALREGKRDGISRDARYQWRRSTAQAAGGLDALS